MLNSKFQLPRFYPIADTAVLAEFGVTPLALAEEAAAAGVGILQYRHKGDWTQEHFEEALTLAGICREAGVLFIINDRADFAQLLEAGLHLGQHDLPPVAARRVTPDALIGFSTHNARQLRLANEEPVEYVSVGPIFATESKRNPDPVIGLEGLRELSRLALKPLVAIGGITLENASDVVASGASSVAVISGLLPHEPNRVHLRERLTEWLSCLSETPENKE